MREPCWTDVPCWARGYVDLHLNQDGKFYCVLDMLHGEFMASATIDPALADGTAGWPTELVGRVPHDLFT